MATKTVTVYTKLTRDLATGKVRVKLERGAKRTSVKPTSDQEAKDEACKFVQEALDELR